MKRLSLLLSLVAMAAAGALAQPVIGTGGIVQAANYTPSDLPNASLAPGSIFSIYGTGFNTAVVSATAGQPLATNLGGTTVTFTVSGKATQALLLFVDGGQINGILPSTVAAGNASVTVAFGGQTSAAAPMPIVASNFASFTLNGGGTGPAAAQNFPSYQVNTLVQTVEPSGVLILYGTGLGPGVGGQDQTSTGTAAGYGTDLRSVDNLNLHLYVGGVDATSNILYAGRAEFAGEDQINFTVPSNVPTGCYVPVIVTSGGVVSNSASISINTTGTTCSDPMGLTSAQINQAATGTLNVGSLVLTRLALNIGLGVPITQDDAEAHFYAMSSGYYSSPLYSPDFISISSFGSCEITTCSNTYTCVPSAQGLPAPELDAGAALSVSGSGQGPTSVPKQTNGSYSAQLGANPIPIGTYPLDAYLQPGTFSFSGTGGSVVGSFNASITVPAPMTLQAKDSAGNVLTTSAGAAATNAVINRANNLTVTWTPGSSSDYTLVSVSSAISTATANAAPYNSATITCLQPSSSGSVTIPSWLLQALPVSSEVTLANLPIQQDTGAILIGSFNVTNTFSASGLNVGLANSIVSSGANFPVQ